MNTHSIPLNITITINLQTQLQ